MTSKKEQANLLNCLSWCSVRQLPEEWDKKNVYIKAIAKVISPLNADIIAQGIIIVPAPKIGRASTKAINIAIKNGYLIFKLLNLKIINPINTSEKEINISIPSAFK